ncbi:hypothetical protein [Microvirga pudoricolor]|uniref:hypothetical protein n=1 Tax=Microvirga pudoricolor TaxID=2778729 RepID=UPI00194F1B2F|nr:hypothetical protein [Microvirga pudoricolor]MBM6595361.1 hypothetical protein [Microvirga pudoricolor]
MSFKPTTRAQRQTIKRLYNRSVDGSPSYREFRKRFVHYGLLDIYGGTWCGMFIGIELDGHAHS